MKPSTNHNPGSPVVSFSGPDCNIFFYITAGGTFYIGRQPIMTSLLEYKEALKKYVKAVDYLDSKRCGEIQQ